MKKIKSLAIAIPVVAASVLMFAGTAQATEEGYYPEVGWKVRDIGTSPGSSWVESENSTIVDGYTVRLKRDHATVSTSIETDNLNLVVTPGDKVTVRYNAQDVSQTAAGAVRLFIYNKANADTMTEAPTQPPAIADAESGVLEIVVNFSGTIGTMGLVYDASNDSTGTVAFRNLTVDGTKVLFLEPEPEPSVEPSESASPSEEPSETPSSSAPPVSTGGDLPITGMNIAAMGTAGAGFIGVGLVALLWGMHRRRETE